MKLTDVLIKPILSEKANKLAEKLNRYAFVVDRKANKVEIKKAVEQFYGVQVSEVNTLVMPSKLKSRYTKAGFLIGRKPAKKKALVTLADGEKIDFFGGESI
jgi:large subunit ribosomal protein L23